LASNIYHLPILTIIVGLQHFPTLSIANLKGVRWELGGGNAGGCTSFLIEDYFDGKLRSKNGKLNFKETKF
jgi:hypothetical protein